MRKTPLLIAAVLVLIVVGYFAWKSWLPLPLETPSITKRFQLLENLPPMPPLPPLEPPPIDGPLKKVLPKKYCYSASDEEYLMISTSISYLYNKALWNMGRTDESVPFIVVLGFTETIGNQFLFTKKHDQKVKEHGNRGDQT